MFLPAPLRSILREWLRGRTVSNRSLFIVSSFGVGLIVIAVVTSIIVVRYYGHQETVNQVGAIVGSVGFVLLMSVAEFFELQTSERAEKKIEVAEQNFRENPEKPQLAWELAQARLESYLDRNLSQVRSIYLWTVVVMTVGFLLIGIGAFEAFQDPNKFKAAELSAISGVLVSFIGGTFMIIYKATMAQAKDYVTILERINAVGMSVQILESLTKDDLKQESLADIAKSLLHMYSPQTGRVPTKAQGKKPTKEQ